MSQSVNIRNITYDKLKFFKEKRNFRSFTQAIDELLLSYWSPSTAEIQVQEHINELRSWLQSRELLDTRSDEALQITQARVLQYKSAKKDNLQKK